MLVERDGVKVEYLATLSAHTKGVNVVKIGLHEGEMHIASAGDDHQIKLWVKKDGEVAEPEFGAAEGVVDKETWVVKTSLRYVFVEVRILSNVVDMSQMYTTCSGRPAASTSSQAQLTIASLSGM